MHLFLCQAHKKVLSLFIKGIASKQAQAFILLSAKTERFLLCLLLL
jgi:hypothetical protein